MGGKIVKADIQHIDEVLEGGENAYTSNPSNQSALPLSPRLEEGIAKLNLGGSGPGVGGQPDALIVCPGLGARTLGGVEDKDVYPVRGQTVVLKAPWVKFGRTFRNGEGDGGRGEWTYVIPRRCGDVSCSNVLHLSDLEIVCLLSFFVSTSGAALSSTSGALSSYPSRSSLRALPLPPTQVRVLFPGSSTN